MLIYIQKSIEFAQVENMFLSVIVMHFVTMTRDSVLNGFDGCNTNSVLFVKPWKFYLCPQCQYFSWSWRSVCYHNSELFFKAATTRTVFPICSARNRSSITLALLNIKFLLLVLSPTLALFPFSLPSLIPTSLSLGRSLFPLAPPLSTLLLYIQPIISFFLWLSPSTHPWLQIQHL